MPFNALFAAEEIKCNYIYLIIMLIVKTYLQINIRLSLTYGKGETYTKTVTV
jgi:hypothetical protein